MKKILCTFMVISILISMTCNSFGYSTNDISNLRSVDTPDILDGMVYEIRNVNSQKYLTVKNSNSSSGASIVQCSHNNTDSQKFRLEYTDSGYYHIIPLLNQSLRVDVVNASDTTYTLIQTFYPNDAYANAQQFKFIQYGDCSYYIMPRLSTTRVFDVVNASLSDNADVQLYPMYNQPCQRWTLEMVTNYVESDFEEESNDTISTANTVTLSEHLDIPSRKIGLISSNSDVDYYKISPPRHGYLEIELIPAIGCDYELYLYNSSGTLIDNSCSSGDYNEHIFLPTLRNSTLDKYYVKVLSYSGFSNSVTYLLVFHYRDMHNKLCCRYPLTTSVSNNKVVNSPVGYRSYDNSYHYGIDLNASSGQTVFSILPGRVTTSTSSSSAGNYIVVKTDCVDPMTGNNIYIRYLHLSSRSVSQNDVVQRGTVLGYSGNTGNSGGPHLHIDANNGNYTNSTGMLGSKTSIINLTDLFSNNINFSTGKPYLNS